MQNHYRFTTPPKALGRPDVQLDNFSLVSASMLADMSAYQALTDRQPKGTAVLVLPSPNSPLRGVYAAVARVMEANGRRVTMILTTSAKTSNDDVKTLIYDTAGEVRMGHAAINVTNGERRVLARGMSANHSLKRKKLSATAVSRCPRRAFVRPI